jgi:hypothetical protein
MSKLSPFNPSTGPSPGDTSSIPDSGMIPGLNPNNSVLNPSSTQFNESGRVPGLNPNNSSLVSSYQFSSPQSPPPTVTKKKKSGIFRKIFKNSPLATVASA